MGNCDCFAELITKIQKIYPDTRIVINFDIVDSDIIFSVDCYSIFNDVKMCNIIYKTTNIKYLNDLINSFIIENEDNTYKKSYLI